MSLEESDLSSLLSSTSLIFLGVVLTSVGTLLERVVIARIFSQGAYGEVSLGLAILTVATSVSMLGLNHGVPRYISRFDDEADRRGVWAVGVGLSLAIGTVLALFLGLNTGIITNYLFDNDASDGLLILFVVAIPITVGLRMGLAAIRGMENTVYKVAANDVLYPALRLGLLLGFVGLGVGVSAAGYAYIVAGLVAFVVAHVLLARLVPLVGPVNFHVRTLVGFSAPLVVSMVLAVLLTRMDTLMVGFFRSSAEVGVYAAVFPLAMSLQIFVSSFGYLYLPMTSRMDADGEHGAINQVYQLTTKWSFVLSFPAFLLLTVFAGDVLALVFGPSYREGALALVVLSVGLFSSAALGRNRETLSALGQTNWVLVADTSALAVNLVVNLALIPAYGYEGAAVASTVAFLARNALIYAVLRLAFGITPFSSEVVRMYTLLPLLTLPPAVYLASDVTLTLLLVPVVLVATGLVTLVLVVATGCVQPLDLVALEFVEDQIGVEIPLVRRFLPSREGS